MDQRETGRIDEVLKLAGTRVPAAQRAAIAAFVPLYFRQVDPEELAERGTEDLLGAALSHWQWGATRTRATPKVRVLNPSASEQGWASRHSVIEIVNDDMPFLVDSVTMEINRQGLTLHLIVHPVFAVERDLDGKLMQARSRVDAPDAPRESWMHFEVDRLVDAEQRAKLVAGIEKVLADVRAAVEDWKPAMARLREAIEDLDAAPKSLDRSEVTETRAFLQWLAEDHFVLLGYRQHELVVDQGQDALKLVWGSGLGVLRETEEEKNSVSFAALPPQARALARAASPIAIINKANTRSSVHRPGYTDYVGVKRYDAQGKVIGEHRFLGLFTSTAYSARVHEVPIVRGKVEAVVARATAVGVAAGGHSSKALSHILESYPRDELFQISADELYAIATGILQLGERQRLRLFVRRDPFDRFVSCLIFVPRESYSTELRRRFLQTLTAAFDGGTSEFDVLLSDDVLARIHITVRTTPGKIPAYDRTSAPLPADADRGV